MSKIRSLPDGNYEMTMPDGKIMRSSHPAALAYTYERRKNAPDPQKFLYAWQRGVEIAGGSFFKVRTATVQDATDKWDLEPDWDEISKHNGGLSRGERYFLHAMCSFFDAEWAAEQSARFGDFGNPGEIVVRLDHERRPIICDLMRNYRGW